MLKNKNINQAIHILTLAIIIITKDLFIKFASLLESLNLNNLRPDTLVSLNTIFPVIILLVAVLINNHIVLILFGLHKSSTSYWCWEWQSWKHVFGLLKLFLFGWFFRVQESTCSSFEYSEFFAINISLPFWGQIQC